MAIHIIVVLSIQPSLRKAFCVSVSKPQPKVQYHSNSRAWALRDALLRHFIDRY